MPTEILMPRMGQGMDEGRVVRWLKPVGAPLRKGEPLVEIETDKANIEVDAPAAGVLAAVLVGEDQVAPVGTAIGLVADSVAGAAPSPAAPSPVGAKAARIPASPLARRLAAEQGIDLTTVTGSGPDGRIGKADIARALAAHSETRGETRSDARPARVNASPVARRLAEEQGVDLAQLRGSGPGGMVGKEDVLAHLTALEATRLPEPAPQPEPQPQPTAADVRGGRAPLRLPLSKARQAIARRMVESKQSAPHFYVSMDMEMGQAMALRDSFKQRGRKVGLNAILLKAAALALAAHPALNASFAGDAIEQHAQIDLAIAVALEQGLLTPVVHGCESLSLIELAQESAEVITRARSGRLLPADLEGGTFTVSNLGMYGVRHFEAILNPPQAAILALGGVRREPRFDKQERVVAAHVLTATLSVDHRVADGAEAARFLRTMCTLLEDGFALL